MRTLATVAAAPAPTGTPLPVVFVRLADNGIRPRRGTVTMLAGPPGAGKTMLALYWVARMGLPTLYFSADTDPMTMTTRSLAMTHGIPLQQAERLLAEGADLEPLKGLHHIRWVFETDPTYRDVELETAAFAEVYGDWPEVIVIDNLMNLVGQNEDEWGSMRDHTKALHRLCRITDAGLFVMHHMSEGTKDIEYPCPRRDLQGKVAQVPEMILSLALPPDSHEVRIACVKQRWGPSDPSGRSWTPLYVEANTNTYYNTRQAWQAGIPA